METKTSQESHSKQGEERKGHELFIALVGVTGADLQGVDSCIEEDQKPPFTDSKNVKAQPKESCVGDSLDTKINSDSVRLSPEDNVRRAIRAVSLWPGGKEQDMRDFLSSD